MFSTDVVNPEPNRYNALPDVVDADMVMKPLRRHLENLVEAGSQACGATPFLHGELGAFLLHRHWEVSAGEAMIERHGRHPLGIPALITTAEQFAGGESMAPSRFQVDPVNKQLLALEFSSDRAVLESWRVLQTQPQLIDRLAWLISDSGLSDRIGLAILAREVSMHDGEDLIEENWGRQSVVSAQPLPVENDQTAVIPTGWGFVSIPITAAGSCIAYCMQAGSSAHCVHHYNRPQVLEQ